MAEECGFFNAQLVDDEYDRVYLAEQFASYFASFIGNGVFADSSDGLQVVAKQTPGMYVEVKSGHGWINGYWYKNTDDLSLSIDVADGVFNRIDSVMLRLGVLERSMWVYVKKGVAQTNPLPPDVVRDAEYYELKLADIYINAGTIKITQANITDTRMNNDVCGFVTGLIKQVETSTLYIQWQEAFNDWFSDIKDTLSKSTLIRSYRSVYNTSIDGELHIPIQISQYNRNLDILNVYVNGIMLIEDVEYTIVDNDFILLAKGLDIKTPVSFIIYKSVDGSEAETVVQQVYELQNYLDKIKVTTVTGDVKVNLTNPSLSVLDTFIELGVGFHTLYASEVVQDIPVVDSFNLFGQLLSNGTGYLLAIQRDRRVYVNYFNDNLWIGWKELTTYDSGWIELPLNSGITAYSEESIPKYRKIGNNVFIKGVVEGIVNNNTLIGILPVGFRPQNVHTFAQIAGSDWFSYYTKMHIETTGGIVVKNVSSSDSTHSFPIDTNFLID